MNRSIYINQASAKTKTNNLDIYYIPAVDQLHKCALFLNHVNVKLKIVYLCISLYVFQIEKFSLTAKSVIEKSCTMYIYKYRKQFEIFCKYTYIKTHVNLEKDLLQCNAYPSYIFLQLFIRIIMKKKMFRYIRLRKRE